MDRMDPARQAYLLERVVLEAEAEVLAVSLELLELLLLSPLAADGAVVDSVDTSCCPSVVGCCCRCLDERRGIYGAAMCWR